jgi:DNA-binding transcriptional LysR family regulator
MLLGHHSIELGAESAVDLDQVEAFLVLCEELHFGRTAERLYRSQPRISRLIASLESEVGATLFERTNRRVSLTPLGSELEARWRPAQAELLAGYAAARQSARVADGWLNVGFTNTTEGPALTRLLDAFARAHPECEVTMVEVSIMNPFLPLRKGEIDVLYDWLVVDEDDLAVGPVLDHQDRLLAVARDDPLARQQHIEAEQLAGRAFPQVPGSFPKAMLDAFFPPFTPSGQPIPRTHLAHSIAEAWTLVARGLVVHPTVTSMASKLVRDDIVLIPIAGLPPLPLGLIWRPAHEHARIRALLHTAQAIEAQ